MSEFTSAPVTGDAAGDAPEGLTPEGIEATLADFRAWLYDLTAVEATPADAPAAADTLDLHTLLAQFVALRHEVNLQTRAVRAQQEQNTQTLEVLSQSVDALTQTNHEAADETDELVRPLLKTLVDVADALGLARRELQRSQQVLAASLEVMAARTTVADGLADTLHRLIDGLFRNRRATRKAARQDAEIAEHIRRMLDALITGYTMSLQRLERALQQQGLEPIPCRGQPFDPEQMEVVEAVADSGHPAGEVIDEARPGYLWNGRVFRYAQVRVAK